MKEEGDDLALERSQEVQNDEVKLTSQQYKALMTPLQQQQNSAHNNSHVNQIGIVTGFVVPTIYTKVRFYLSLAI